MAIKGKKTVAQLLRAISAATYALSAGGASAKLPVDPPLPAPADDVWSTIERITRDNATPLMQIVVAREAGQSELVAAIVQGVKVCGPGATIADCVRQAITRSGGLTNGNLSSLATLAVALESVGVSPSNVARALDAYSTAVAEAISAGTLSEQFAFTRLSESALSSLYL